MDNNSPSREAEGGNPEASKSVEQAQPAATSNANGPTNGKKDSTSEIPMFDLEDVIRFVTTIHEKGLETAKMPDVASGCGYKHASSTPFYRRLVAARLFGLLAASGAELTIRARDYLKPTRDNADKQALQDAVQSVPYYAEAYQRLIGKRFNASLIANEMERQFNLTDGCARGCSKVFESSLRTAGLLSADNTVGACAVPPAEGAPKKSGDEIEDQETDDTQRHTLFLDKQKKRKFTMVAPLAVRKAELERITNWLAVTLMIEEDEQ